MRERAGTLEAATDDVDLFWRRVAYNLGSVVGLAMVAVVIVVALLADHVAPHSPVEQFRDHLLQPPAWFEGGTWSFPLGTDNLGRCMLSRIVHGARLSLLVGAIVVTLSLVVGTAFGVASGYLRGAVDIALMRLIDIILALPSLLLALVIVAVLGPGLINAMIAVAVTYVPHYARLVRASTISEAGREYVIASKVAGAGSVRIMLRTILPNCLAPLIVQATLSFSAAIVDAAALGFLGLGAQPPSPEWGTMLADALKYLQSAPWVATYPGLAILLTVLGFNLIGDALRDIIDPRLKR